MAGLAPDGLLERTARVRAELSGTEEVVVLNTGTGLIYPETMPARPPLPPLPGQFRS